MLKPMSPYRHPFFSAGAKILLVIIIVLLSVVSAWTWSHPLPASAIAGGHDVVQLAYQDVEAIAAAPHPIGSAAAITVRDFIVERLKTFGLHPEIQETTYIMQNGAGIYKGARIQNIVVRIPGAANTGAVLLAAHYDSADYSPGAADDGAGIAAVLEAMHMLAAGRPPRNDVVALFSDGEEIGLVGARAFIAHHPLARQIRFAVNFEARGDKGPSFLFETAGDPAWALREYSAAAPFHFADSMAPFVYSLLPNDTDFTIFRRARISGLNFAFFDNWPYYHSAADTPLNLSKQSLKEQVLTACFLAQSMGRADLRSPAKEDAVYFSVLSRWTFIYSYRMAVIFAVVSIIVYVTLIVSGFRNRKLTVAGVAGGVLHLLVSVFVVCLVSYTVSRSFWASGEVASYASNFYALAVTILALLVAWPVYLAFSAKVNVENLVAGAMLWWAGLVLFTSILAPALSYLFTWPFVGALVALAAVCLASLSSRRVALIWSLLLIAAVATIFIWTATIRTLYAGLPGREFLVAGLVALALGLLVLQVWASIRNFVWGITALLGAASILTYWVAQRHAKFQPSQPKHDLVQYVFDADRNLAAWTTDEHRRDAWTNQFVDGSHSTDIHLPPWLGSPMPHVISSAAPVNELAPPSIAVLSSSNTVGKRTMTLLVTSQRQAPETVVHVHTEGKILQGALAHLNLAQTPLWNGRIEIARAAPRPELPSDLTVYFYAIPPEGIPLELETDGTAPLDVTVVDRSYSLPDALQSRFHPRAPSIVSGGDASLAIRSYRL